MFLFNADSSSSSSTFLGDTHNKVRFRQSAVKPSLEGFGTTLDWCLPVAWWSSPTGQDCQTISQQHLIFLHLELFFLLILMTSDPHGLIWFKKFGSFLHMFRLDLIATSIRAITSRRSCFLLLSSVILQNLVQEPSLWRMFIVPLMKSSDSLKSLG